MDYKPITDTGKSFRLNPRAAERAESSTGFFFTSSAAHTGSTAKCMAPRRRHSWPPAHMPCETRFSIWEPTGNEKKHRVRRCDHLLAYEVVT